MTKDGTNKTIAIRSKDNKHNAGSISREGKKAPKSPKKVKTVSPIKKVKATTLNEDKSIANNEEKYIDMLIHLGSEKEIREFSNERLRKSRIFSEVGLSDKDFTLDELKEISIDGRTQMFKMGVNKRDLFDSYTFINTVVNRLVRKTLAKANPEAGTSIILPSNLRWTRETNEARSYPVGTLNYEGVHSILLPPRSYLVDTLESNEQVILEDMSKTLFVERVPQTGYFEGNLILSIDEDKNLKIDYSQFNCTCINYQAATSCTHSLSIEIALRQRLIGLDYTNRGERFGG